jgi:hypothetical protein
MKKTNVEKFLGIKIVQNILSKDYKLSELQKNNLETYFDLYGYRRSQDKYTRLAHFIDQGIVNFIGREKELLVHNRMSVDYFCILYGEILGKEKWNAHTKSTRKGRPNCKEYWICKGYSEEESIRKVSEHQQIMSHRSSKNRDHRKHSIRCKEYWIEKGYTDSTADELVSDNQKRDLAFYIEKYGLVEGAKKYTYSCNKRKATWKNKSFEEIKAHYLKTIPQIYNENGQEMQAIRLFLEQNNIDEELCKFGAPKNQFYQWIDEIGFRRYDLAIFSDRNHAQLTAIMEFHGPGHINFSDYDEQIRNCVVEVDGKKLPHLGTYGMSYDNDMIKRNHILRKYPDCKYYVFWNRDLKNKDLKIK